MASDLFKPFGPLPGGSGPLSHGQRGGPHVCEACNGVIKGPDIFGGGRFCSQLCSKLRTPEKHWEWLLEHPDELEKWQEAEKTRNKKTGNTIRGGFPLL